MPARRAPAYDRGITWRGLPMRSMLLKAAAAACLLALAGLARAGELARRPLLLELFTSQGCSSCPPADALLRELAAQPDLLPLSFHVDYWNEQGWEDTFSAPEFTARQQDYAASGQGFQVYTPQLVVEGRQDAVGSNRAAVARALEAAREHIHVVPAAIASDGAAARWSVGRAADKAAAGEIYLISFDASRSVSIGGGENSGRRLAYTNVVRTLRRLGSWGNTPLQGVETLRPREQGGRLALLVQGRDGTVWGLAATPPGP
jgi:hypothetical protein